MIQIGKYKRPNIFNTDNIGATGPTGIEGLIGEQGIKGEPGIKYDNTYSLFTRSNTYEDDDKINLNNPIFVYYLCIKNMSRVRGYEMAAQVENQFSKYKDITMWIVPTEEPSKIECVFNGNPLNNENEKNRFESFDKCETIEDFKREIRQWRLDKYETYKQNPF